MKYFKLSINCFIALTFLFTLSGVSAAEKLGDRLKKEKWDRMIGTWVDEDTNGDRIKNTFAWKYEETLMEITTNDSEKETTSLVGVSQKSGDIFHVAADDQGGSSIGKWAFDEGDFVLKVAYVTGEGQEGNLSARHHFENDDTMIVTLELPEPFEIKLVRMKSSK